VTASALLDVDAMTEKETMNEDANEVESAIETASAGAEKESEEEVAVEADRDPKNTDINGREAEAAVQNQEVTREEREAEPTSVAERRNQKTQVPYPQNRFWKQSCERKH
jgi:hypothetical protein